MIEPKRPSPPGIPSPHSAPPKPPKPPKVRWVVEDDSRARKNRKEHQG